MKMQNMNETQKYVVNISTLKCRVMSNNIFLNEGQEMTYVDEENNIKTLLCVKKQVNEVFNKEFFFVVDLK